MGKGTWSYVIATLVTGIVGTLLVYRACPWKVKFEYDGKVAREILRFGVPFQFQILVNQLGDWVIPMFVGPRFGPSAVGLLTWSAANGKKPIILIDNVTRVAFPHFSRIQDDRAEVERTVARYLSAMLAGSALWFALLLVAGPALIQWIYSGKWIGATTTLALYSLMLSFEIISFVTSVALNGIGKVKFLAKVALGRSLLYIAGSIPLVLLVGYNGVPIAILISQFLTVPWAFSGLGPGSLQRTMRPIAWVLIPTIISVGVGLAARQIALPPPTQSLFLSAVVATVYAATAWSVGPEWLRAMVWSQVARLRNRITQ
jgi:PST family polysaccharide transporter